MQIRVINGHGLKFVQCDDLSKSYSWEIENLVKYRLPNYKEESYKSRFM